MEKKILPTFILLLALSSLFAQVNITFELNTATIDVSPDGIYIAGGTGFGNPGDNQLTDPDGDGTYSITLERETGFSSYYIFLNGNCPDYSCKENLGGLPCGDPANFNDRFLPPVNSDTTVRACYGTCDSDGTCTILTDSINITFQLNTETIAGAIDPTGIFIAGGGNFGNPGDNPMVDPDGDGIYTFTTRRLMGFASYYTFTNGNCGDFSCKEDLEGLPCGDPNSFNDRLLPPTMADTTILVCFGNCADDGSCTPLGINNITIDKNLFTVQPSLVANGYTDIIFAENMVAQNKQLSVINAVGQVIHRVNTQQASSYRVNTQSYANGLYFLSVSTGNTILTEKFIVRN
jgi:hypothetical protein